MAYLDNAGLTYLWQKLKPMINSKQAKITTVSVTISASDWSNKQCTKNVTGVTADNNVIATYAPASKSAYTAADIYCSAQGAGTLTFACETAPTASVTVNVMVID